MYELKKMAEILNPIPEIRELNESLPKAPSKAAGCAMNCCFAILFAVVIFVAIATGLIVLALI